ncbi:MAG: septum formation inhibitor Maf [Actinobacteria bacterium HGW-Actinobacteria-6]|jgi:septum formation protein|nr:MAG: septum formation inhibitor Maf [Actinobacteria bacterium HGW-Actinobacteria-6]
MEPTNSTVLLASASPRRRRLIGWLGLTADVTSVDTPEDLSSPLAAVPGQLAASIAAEKAVAAREAGAVGRLVLAFDTIVVLDDDVLGKPADLDDAYRMLRALSGRTHHVVTGVALFEPEHDAPRTFAVTTRVAMRELSDDDIAEWAAKGELMGCAGAYNIEHHLASVSLDECYQNVAGMPLCHLHAALGSGEVAGGPSGLMSPIAACDAALGRTCALGRTLVR